MEDRSAPPLTPPWRLAVFALATSVGVLGLRLVFSLLAGRVGSVAGFGSSTWATVLTLVGGLLIGHAWTFRLVDPRGWQLVRLGRDALRPRSILLGALLGAAAIAVPAMVLLAAGWLRVQPAAAGDSFGLALRSAALLVPAALWEELLVRGYFFAILREAWGARRAIVVTSMVFGLLHFENAGATVQSVLLVALAGVFLGAILVATGSLYAAWAAHFAWNFVMVGVLHAAVSGIGLPVTDYRVVDAGPDWATGGAWGPEGGILAGLGMLAALLFLFRRHGRRAE